MTPIPTPIDIMAAKIKPLSPRHRIAHLRALISELPDDSIRRDQLAALLRDAMMAPPANENRAP
jgi:hypothetical protein